MLDNWFAMALAALLCYGFFAFLYKVAAVKGLNSVAIVTYSTATVFVLGALTMVGRGVNLPARPELLWLAVGNGCFFMFGSVMKVESLKFLPAALAFSLSKTNILFILLAAIVIFGERPSSLQLLGIAAAVTMIMVARRNPCQGPECRLAHSRGIFLALGGALCTALTISFGRLAARSEMERVLYVTLSYGLASAGSFVWNRYFQHRDYRLSNRGILLAVGAGILNFIGYLFVLQALAVGELSAAQPVMAMSILVPITLSTLVFKEKLTARNLLALILAVVAALLLKLG